MVFEVFRRGFDIVQFAYKTADQIVNNSTVLVNATDLVLTLKPNTRYGGNICFIVNTSLVADIRMAFAAIAGSVSASWNRNNQVPAPFGTAVQNYAGQGDNRINFAPFTLETGAAGGVIQFQFAQNTAEVSDTTLLLGSWIMCVEEHL